jgi:uncharacterized membrane protein YgdD (TMEM256/DUF423 family)
MRAIIVAAALLGLLLVAAGAAGAHTVPIDANKQWQSAMLYGFVHTLAAVVAAIMFRSRLQLASGWAFILSVVMFSGIQIGKIMLCGHPRATPVRQPDLPCPCGAWRSSSAVLLGLSAATAPKLSRSRRYSGRMIEAA